MGDPGGAVRDRSPSWDINKQNPQIGWGKLGRRKPVATINTKAAKYHLCFAKEIDIDGTMHPNSQAGVYLWLAGHEIDIGPQGVRQELGGSFVVKVTEEMHKKAQEAAAKIGNNKALRPIWTEVTAQAVDRALTINSDLDKYVQYTLRGLTPGSDNLSDTTLATGIRELLSTRKIRHRDSFVIRWNKERVERLAILNLHSDDAEKIKSIAGQYLFGHSVDISPSASITPEWISEERMHTAVVYGLHFRPVGKDLDILRSDLGAKAVRIEGFRDKAGNLKTGNKLLFVFKNRELLKKIANQPVFINGRVFTVRPLMHSDGEKNYCCFTCGSDGHLSISCSIAKRRRDDREERTRAKVDSFLKGNLNRKQAEAFAQKVSISVAMGRPLIPDNHASYALAAKHGASVDPHNRAQKSSTPSESKNITLAADSENAEELSQNAETLQTPIADMAKLKREMADILSEVQQLQSTINETVNAKMAAFSAKFENQLSSVVADQNQVFKELKEMVQKDDLTIEPKNLIKIRVVASLI